MPCICADSLRREGREVTSPWRVGNEEGKEVYARGDASIIVHCRCIIVLPDATHKFGVSAEPGGISHMQL